MAEITPTISNGIATAPKRTPGYYRVPTAQTVSNGINQYSLMGAPVFSTGETQSKWNLLCFDTWAEVIAALQAEGIDTSKMKDPNATPAKPA